MTGEGQPVRLGQLVAAELALLLVVATYPGPLWLLTAAGAAAGAVLLAAFGRSGGRWWYQAVAYRRRFARRRRHAAASVVDGTVSHGIGATASTPAVAWLRSLAPGFRVSTVTVRGSAVGVAVDECAGGGWFAVVALDGAAPGAPDTGLSGRVVSTPPLDLLESLVSPAPAGRPPVASSVQLVVHTVAGPDPQDGPAGAAYRELAGPDRVVARRLTFVAVRLAAADAVTVEARGGLSAVETAVGTAALRVARTLRERGYPARALDPAGLTAALLDVGTVDGAPQEHWNVWASGDLARTCHVVTRWPDQVPVARLAGLAGGVSTVAVSFGAPATEERPVTRHSVFAVAAAPGALAALNRAAVDAAGQLGLRLRRLDGEQALGVYACLPTGVTAGDLTQRAPALGAPAPEPAGWSITEGLLLGRDAGAEPVVIRFFRPQGTRLAAVGGWWLPRLIAFRALATGARVVVRTGRPERWTGLGEAAGAGARYFVVPADRTASLAGTAHAPVLFVDDEPTDPAPADPLPVGAWQTRLVVVAVLGPAGVAEMAAADAVLLQRLEPDEAAVATSVLRLADQTTRLIQVMHDDMVALLGGGADRYLWTTPTRVEEAVLGAARRGS